MKINGRKIGPDEPPYIICEISANHNGDIERVFKLIDAASGAGASAIKIQTFTPATITMDSGNDDFIVKKGMWKGRRLYDLYREAHIPYEWHERIFDYARKVQGIDIFSSVFDENAVDLLEGLNNPCYKIASFELTDIPLIEYAAKTGKPMIISTGMGSDDEINKALQARNRFSRNSDIALLHCVSAYPTPPQEANLPKLGPLSEIQGGQHVVGLSDHTLGIGVAVAGVAYGASIIEKHFTLCRMDGGPDADFSLEPHEFALMVKSCKEAWQATRPSLSKSQEDNKAFRRSIYVTKNVSAGEKLTKENVRVIRPAYGLQPKFFPLVLGQVAQQDLLAGTPLSLDHLVSSGE